MCTLLHPSMKHFHIAPDERNKALELVKKELLKRAAAIDNTTGSKAPTTTVSTTFNTTTSTSSNSLLFRCFDQPQPLIKPTSTPVDELHEYMLLDVQIHEHEDVLLFWKKNEKSFPILSSIVCDLFAIPASNTIVERLFSSSKNTVTD